MVLVHGINCNPAANAGPRAYWGGSSTNSFLTTLNNEGFNYFLADHSGPDTTNPTREAEGDTWGCGELTDMWAAISNEIDAAKGDYNQGYIPAGQGRDGTDDAGNQVSHVLFPTIGSRKQHIAVQKVDITAHSYGGLLSRWYVEQATAPGSSVAGSLFSSRSDVRKLIELGTPNQGSPEANMVDEVFKGTLNPTGQVADETYTNGLIAGAYANIPGLWLSMGNTLARLDRNGYTGNLTPLTGVVTQRPTSLDPLRTQPLHFYQDACINSAVLAQLNATPFNSNVSYAAVVGTTCFWTENALSLFEPIASSGQSLFPWMNTLDGAGSDGVVPGWSAQLGVPAFNVQIPVSHGGMTTNTAVEDTVRAWLNGVAPGSPSTPAPLPLGSAQRAAWNSRSVGIPVSDRNAYVGSTQAGGTSTGGGLNRNAIVKVELAPSDTTAFYGTNSIVYGIAPSQVGPQSTAITGMIEVRNINLLSLQINAGNRGWTGGLDGEVAGPTLRNLGTLTAAQLNIPTAALAGAGQNDWVPFRVTNLGPIVTDTRIGRTANGSLTGPDGISTQWGNTQYAGYTLAVVGGGTTLAPAQSPFTAVAMPAYSLPAPVETSVDRSNPTPIIYLNVQGSVEVSGLPANTVSNGTTTQWVSVQICYGSDQCLTIPGNNLMQPAGVWNGLLMAYSLDAVLFIDPNGVVYGPCGTSGATSVDIYQYLVSGALRSATTTIP